jgi:phosphonate transport system substrate-binding protein
MASFRAWRPWALLGAAAAAGLAAWVWMLSERPVDARVSLAAPAASPRDAAPREPAFRVAVSTMLSPVRSLQVYHDLGEQVAREVGRPIVFIPAKSYNDVNDLLRQDRVDMAFVCVGGYLGAPEAMDVVAAPVYDGEARFRALIITPQGSAARTLADLRGKRFMCPDPLSFTGTRYPRQRLAEMGETLETFFGEVQWTESHDQAFYSVAYGRADGASIGSVIFRMMAARYPEAATKVRVIEESPWYPSPPVVVRKSMPEEERRKVLAALTGLAKSEAGRLLLEPIGASAFVPARNEDYLALMKKGVGE